MAMNVQHQIQQRDCEMQNSNKDAAPLHDFVPKSNVEQSLMFIYIHIHSYVYFSYIGWISLK